MTRRPTWAAILCCAVALGATGCAPSDPPAGDPLAHASVATRRGPSDAVLTQRGDNTRLGWSATEKQLTVGSVSSGRFGRRAAYPVDGKVFAEPLYVPGLAIGGGTRDVVIVATEHDTVYAFDADGTGSSAPLWRSSLLQPGARTFLAATDRVGANRLCDSITPEVGVTSTPVIDWSTKTIYVMALDVEHGAMTYRIHALDLATGTATRPSTVVSAAVSGKGLDAVGGKVTFAANDEQQRMGLTLVNGVVYAGFASWCDFNPYHGWVLGYRAADLSRAVVYNSSPDEYGSGLWESQAGITADEHGHLVLVTGNGRFDLNSGGSDAGDSVLVMTPQDGTLRVVDYFAPFDQECLARHDQELGSASPLMVPGHNEFMVSLKTGGVFVLDRDHLGGYTPLADPCQHKDRTDVDKIKQELPPDTVQGGMWGTFAYWKSPTAEYIYGSGTGSRLTQWRLSATGTVVATPIAQGPEQFAYPGAIPVVSSDGTAAGSGIVWTIDASNGATLRAFDAADVGHEVWASSGNPARDGLDDVGDFNHFVAPTVADGRVFVGDQRHLEIYGLLGP